MKAAVKAGLCLLGEKTSKYFFMGLRVSEVYLIGACLIFTPDTFGCRPSVVPSHNLFNPNGQK